MTINFRTYLESIGAKAGDKLEFVEYTKGNMHSHWGFHRPNCSYKNFRVGEDGYMYSSHPDGGEEDYKHETNWGFVFKVVKPEPQGSVYYKDVHEYCVKNGFKDGDELEFVKYAHRGHEHWNFHTGTRYKNIRVEDHGGALGIYMNFIDDGKENHLWYNYGFIFKLKEKSTEEVKEVKTRPIWCGKLFGKMTEVEKGAFLLDVLAGKKAYYGDCGNSVDGPEDGEYGTVKEYVQRFNKAREPAYYYYSSRALLESAATVRRLEKEIADPKRQQEDKERSVKYLKQKQEEKEQQLAKLLS